MNDIDKKTVEIILERYDILNLISRLLKYTQESNKEIVAIKRLLEVQTGIDILPLSEEQKKDLRKGGDAINDICNIIEKGKRLKDARRT